VSQQNANTIDFRVREKTCSTSERRHGFGRDLALLARRNLSDDDVVAPARTGDTDRPLNLPPQYISRICPIFPPAKLGRTPVMADVQAFGLSGPT
jgi:hypothetical protein